MGEDSSQRKPRILVLATSSCAYPGADSVGQVHSDYSTATYILRVPAPVPFREEFYLRCFDKGIGGIIVMSCGHECPYAGAYDRLARRISSTHKLMKERGLSIQRLRLCAICTVCVKAFLREIHQMEEVLARASRGDGAGE
jgi:F420-non-reducing hydrogenase iron-sulfur subunit